jgi:hypothetical protein
MPLASCNEIPPEDKGYTLIDDYWNMSLTGSGTLIWGSSALPYGYGPDTGQDVYDMGPLSTIAITSSDANLYLVGTGPDKRIYYNIGTLDNWTQLPGASADSPAAAFLENKLHIVVNGLDGNIYHGYVDLSTSSFSGWTQLSGSTPSPPTLTTSATKLYLVVRGMNEGIYYNVWSGSSWAGWTRLPGATAASPSAAILDNNLHLVVLGTDGNMYHGYLDLTDGWTGWTKLSGATPSAPALAASADKLYLVVRGNNDHIYYNIWSGVWDGWAFLGGVTQNRPAATVQNDKLHIVIKAVPPLTTTASYCYQGSYYGYVDLVLESFSGWKRLVTRTLGELSWGSSVDRLWAQFVNPTYGVWDLGDASKEIVVFPQQDHGPYPEEALEYKIWGSNDFDINDPESAVWVEADLDRIYTKGWSDVGEGVYETCNDDYVAVWDFNCSSYRYVKLQSIWEPPYDEPEIDAVKGVLGAWCECNYTGRTVGFWKTNIAKALGICKGKQQVSTEDILGCLENIATQYGSSYPWLNFSQDNETKLSEAYLILSFYHCASNMTYKARGQILALLLTVCHFDCASTSINIPWYNSGETHSVNQWITIIFQEYDSKNFETAKDLADFLNNWS